MKKYKIFFDVMIETSRVVEADSLENALKEFKVAVDDPDDSNTSVVSYNVFVNKTYEKYVTENFYLHFSGYLVDKITGNPVEEFQDSLLDSTIKRLFKGIELISFEGKQVYYSNANHRN